MNAIRWQPVHPGQLAAFGIGSALFLILALTVSSGFLPILDHANLLFHEAGHLFLGLFSRRLEIYGGTVGQLVFPACLIVHFYRQRTPIPYAVAWLWFFENWLNIARYVADASTRSLPLVGGELHDWHTILSRWDALAADQSLAHFFGVSAWVGITLTLTWVLWRSLLREPPPPAPLEIDAR